MTAIERQAEYSIYQRQVGLPGDLTLSILGVLWRAERPLSVTMVHRAVRERYKPVALTTVSSTLARLGTKGWVSKPRQHVYQAAITRNALIADISDRLSALIDETVLAIEEV